MGRAGSEKSILLPFGVRSKEETDGSFPFFLKQ